MSVEQAITISSLIIVAIFYLFTIIVFLISRKNLLNYALATQKGAWLVLVIGIAIPAYSEWYTPMTMPWRAIVWAGLAICSVWVMYEVYRVNWGGSATAFLKWVWCNATGLCKRDRQRPTV